MEAATARYVAVSGQEALPQEPESRVEVSGQDPARRREAAREAAAGQGPVLLTLAAAALALCTLAAFEAAPVTVWAVPAFVALLPWLVPPSVRRSHGRACVFVGWTCLGLLAALPWLPGDAAPRRLAIVLGASSTVAMGAATLLAPRAAAATLASLLPASAALAALRLSGATQSAWFGIAGLVSCAMAGLLSASSRRAWRAGFEAALLREERIAVLTEARDQAWRADAEKSRFLAIASHDLRQPVHALGLFAATLDKRLRGSRDEPLMRNVTRSIDGLERSFNAMLDISRLDAGSIEPNVQQFPLRDLFRRLHMHFAGQAERRNLGLRFWPGGKSVSSDPQLLERVLGNLVQNAIKYTAEGGVVVVARSTSTHINVEVWDTGMGIAADELPQVFDEFYQVGRNERSRVQGLGMGLAIVKRLCRLLGVKLAVASRPGHGTMFRVGIPLTSLADVGPVTAAADTLPQPVPQRTVLILDDEGAIREGLRLLLEEWGYEALTAGTIAEAERTVTALSLPPHLILSDLHLGRGPDGIAAIASIRRQCGYDVPAVLITGDASPVEVARIGESGHPVLFKPVRPGKLYDAVRTAIG